MVSTTSDSSPYSSPSWLQGLERSRLLVGLAAWLWMVALHGGLPTRGHSYECLVVAFAAWAISLMGRFGWSGQRAYGGPRKLVIGLTALIGLVTIWIGLRYLPGGMVQNATWIALAAWCDMWLRWQERSRKFVSIMFTITGACILVYGRWIGPLGGRELNSSIVGVLLIGLGYFTRIAPPQETETTMMRVARGFIFAIGLLVTLSWLEEGAIYKELVRLPGFLLTLFAIACQIGQQKTSSRLANLIISLIVSIGSLWVLSTQPFSSAALTVGTLCGGLFLFAFHTLRPATLKFVNPWPTLLFLAGFIAATTATVLKLR